MHGCIEVHSLDCRFGQRTALSGVDLVVAAGQIHGLLGPRGAGKTTLLRTLAGELESHGGSVRVPAAVTFVTADDVAASALEARRRIALARTVAGALDVLLVDEPQDGLDAETAAVTRSLALRHAAANGTVIWATRRLDALLGLASGVTMLANGRVRYAGSVEALADRALTGLPITTFSHFKRAA